MSSHRNVSLVAFSAALLWLAPGVARAQYGGMSTEGQVIRGVEGMINSFVGGGGGGGGAQHPTYREFGGPLGGSSSVSGLNNSPFFNQGGNPYQGGFNPYQQPGYTNNYQPAYDPNQQGYNGYQQPYQYPQYNNPTGYPGYQPQPGYYQQPQQPAYAATQRYQIPQQYAATPAGTVITYGSYNYLIGADGTMTAYSGPAQTNRPTQSTSGGPVPGQRYQIPEQYENSGAGSTITYAGYRYVINADGTMTSIAGQDQDDDAQQGPVPGQRYQIPDQYAGSVAGSVITYGNSKYVVNADNTMTALADGAQ